MNARGALHILPLLLLPALIGCGGDAPAGPPPISETALAATVADPGISRERLARAVDALFESDGIGETRALIVISNGRIVAERYAPDYNKDTRFLGWSLTKSITGVMIGQLVADGRLRLDETAPVPAWQRAGDPRGDITLRQLLQMRSGLRHSEGIEPRYESDEVRMLFLDGRDNMAAWAEAQPLEAEPGRKFEYSSGTSMILADIAARALTENPDPAFRRKIVSDYLRTRLLDPIGMTSAVPEFDKTGTFIGSSMLHATARDWAKFGEFLRNDGAVKGAQLTPTGWIEFMTTPSPRNSGYGAHLWLNRKQANDDQKLFPGRATSDVFASVGHLGQYIIVSPRQRLTIVRLGKTEKPERAVLLDRLADLVELFPRR